jgi:hypothetical protein
MAQPQQFETLVKIGIDSKVVQDSIKNADRLTAEIAKLRAEQKASGVQDAETTAKIKALTQERSRDLRVVQQAQALASETVKGQERLKAELSLLTVQYNNLTTEEQRNTEAGRKMGNQIRNITEELKANEKAIGDNRRNVGNYEGAMRNVLTSLSGAVPAFRKATAGAKGFNATLSANPIGAVVLVLTQLVAMFKSNTQVADQLAFAMSGLSSGLRFITDTIVSTVTNFDKLGEAMRNPIKFIRELASGAKEAAGEGKRAAQEMDALKVASANTSASIRENAIQVRALTMALKDKTKSEQERIAIANKIADLEIESANMAMKLAKEQLAAEELMLKGKKLSADEQAKLIELRSRVSEAASEQEITNSQRATRINVLLEKEKQAEAKITTDKSIAEAEREAERLKKIADDFVRSRMTERDRRELEIEERTASLRQAGVDEVEINKWRTEEIERIERTSAEARFTQEIELIAGRERLEIEAAQFAIKNTEDLEREKQRIQLKYAQERIAAMRASAMLDGVLTEQEQQNLQLVENQIRRLQEVVADDSTKTLGQMLGLDEQQQQEMMLGLAAVSGALNSIIQATEAASNNRITQIDRELQAELSALEKSGASKKERQAKQAALEKKAAKDRYKIELEQFKVAKALSISLAAANTATAVMAQLSNPTPYAGFVLAALAAATGAVQIGIAAGQQPPPPPQFAAGGFVSGPGSGTSDSITAQLSNGESVNTAEATRKFGPLLSAMNAAGGGVDWYRGEGYAKGGLVRKFAAGGIAVSSSAMIRDNEQNAMMAAQMAASQPVLVIEEFQDVQGRQVRTEQNLQL